MNQSRLLELAGIVVETEDSSFRSLLGDIIKKAKEHGWALDDAGDHVMKLPASVSWETKAKILHQLMKWEAGVGTEYN